MTTVIEQSEFLEVKNRVYSKLAAALTIGGLSLTVTLADAGLFPDLYPYHLTLEDEIVKVTNRVSNTLTIVRAQQDTSAAAHADKTYVALNVTAKAVSDLNAAVNTIEQALESGINNVIINGTADYLIDMEAGTVNSGGADIRLSNEAKIDNTTAGTLKLMTTASGYVSISEGQIIAKCDYLDLDLDVALRFIGSGKNIDGAVIFRDNVTIGRTNAEVNAYLYSNLSIISATTTDPKLRFETTNTAHEVVVSLDESAGHDRLCFEGITASQNMVICFIAPDGEEAEIQLYSGGTNYSSMKHAAGDNFIIRNSVATAEILLQPNNDTTDYFTFAVVSDVPTIYATGSYLRIGDVKATQHSLDAEDDLMVSGDFEVSGLSFFDALVTISPIAAANSHLLISGTAKLNANEQALYINFPLETVATNGAWITLGSTVTSGDLTGARIRVTGNAASAGANVRGAYLEAKGGASKYAAMLEGALIHADYSAGSVTVSGDVRGLTVHISQGASLSAANLYGILLNMQTRSDETITSDDVGLMIRNEAVGGNGRQMDSAIKIAGLNMGGGTIPFAVDITFQNGTTLYDDGTSLTLAGANLVGNLGAVTLNGTVTINGQAFDAGAVDAQVNTTGSGRGLVLQGSNASNGPRLKFDAAETTPDLNSAIGDIQCFGYDHDGTPANVRFGRIAFLHSNIGDGTEQATMYIYMMDAGVVDNLALNLTGAGGLGVDADIGTADDPVALFDDYDDAIALRQGIQHRNHELLADMGIFTRKETGSGYMMNIQPMTRLLAGGIYQNRALIDTVELKIERLEGELAELKASLN